MADLVITLKGDASDFKKQFDDAVKKLNDFGKSTSQATGYIGGMESQMKLLKTQMRSASESDIPALRTQFLQLRTAIREAQYGSESFTKKIGGEFDSALSRAGKKLFDLGNILKASIGIFGVAGLVGKFVEATGAADMLNTAIDGVVNGLKNLNKTQAEIEFNKSTAPLIDKAQKYIESQRPVDENLIVDLQTEIARIQDKLGAGKPQTIYEKELRMPIKPLDPSEAAAFQADIDRLQALIDKIKTLKKVTGGGGGKTIELSALDIALMNEIGSGVSDKTRSESSKLVGNVDLLLNNPSDAQSVQTARNVAANKRWLEDYFKTQEEAINYQEKLQEDAERKRVQIADRYSAGVANVFENAVSAGMQGGFSDFITNYMRQAGVRLFGGLIQLAISSATGGSFGLGNLIPKIFGFAGGGEFYTNGAMPIIVGDNPGGIEKVTVTPISGRGTSGLKNGNIALAGGGSVTSMPMGDGMPEIIFRPIIKFDGYDIAYSLEMPNGGYEKLNRARGN